MRHETCGVSRGFRGSRSSSGSELTAAYEATRGLRVPPRQRLRPPRQRLVIQEAEDHVEEGIGGGSHAARAEKDDTDAMFLLEL